MDPDTRRITVGEEKHLYSRSLLAHPVNFLTGEEGGRAEAKIRYAHGPAACSFSISDGMLRVDFNEPQRAVTPGQSVVLYRGDIVIGGGIIERGD
jgi:tRNA-specific 2-thiouridylase